jgi:hypothetical protein
MPFKKGQSGNPQGRKKGTVTKKRSEWEQMGEALVGPWTDYIKAEGFRMMQEGNWEEFYPLYKDMVNYFKPKLSSAQLQAKADIKIEVKEPDFSDDED